MKPNVFKLRRNDLTVRITALERRRYKLNDRDDFAFMGMTQEARFAELALLETSIWALQAEMDVIVAELRAASPLILVNHVYRARSPRQVGWSVNDRMVLHIDKMGWQVQYDSPSVTNGRHYPKVDMIDFLLWVGEDVTEGYPDGDWADYSKFRKAA